MSASYCFLVNDAAITTLFCFLFCFFFILHVEAKKHARSHTKLHGTTATLRFTTRDESFYTSVHAV